ncbi:MAG: NAD(P)H-hydrate dehydratase [Thermoanaerobacteraceae bacterium]
MILLTSNQMKDVESKTIEKIGISSLCLMENAGRESANLIKENMVTKNLKSVVVITGKGNNGGDGYVIARYLFNWGFNVKVFITSSSYLISGDARKNLDIIMNLGVYVAEITKREHLKFLEKSIKDADIIVDAIYGIGLKGNITGISKEIIDIVNQANKYVISIDVPSGLNADTGMVEGSAVMADKTITMQYIKPGLLVYPGVDYAGEVICIDIGIPYKVIENIKTDYNLIIEKDVVLEKRYGNTHKGDYGKALIIAGSKNMTGAAYMCSKSAIKTGCGIVKLAVPETIHKVLQHNLYEAIIYGIEDESGMFTYKALDYLINLTEEADAVAIGPGIGRSLEVSEFVIDYLNNVNKPIVVDADALFAISGKLGMIKNHNLIFTPHYAEMARLIGLNISEIKKDIFNIVKRFCYDYKNTLVLKGARTVIGTKDGSIYINKTGNPGMATGGSGDVLTGMIVSFLAQGFDIPDAAVYGVYYHGKSGNLASGKFGEYGMSATDIINFIPEALYI